MLRRSGVAVSEEGELVCRGEADHRRAHGVGATVGVDQDEVSAPEGLDTPVLFVQPVVVMPAHERQVVGFGVAAIEPVHRVVRIAARRGDRAAGESAAVIA